MKRLTYYYVFQVHFSGITCHGRFETALDSLSSNSIQLLRILYAQELRAEWNKIRIKHEELIIHAEPECNNQYVVEARRYDDLVTSRESERVNNDDDDTSVDVWEEAARIMQELEQEREQ